MRLVDVSIASTLELHGRPARPTPTASRCGSTGPRSSAASTATTVSPPPGTSGDRRPREGQRLPQQRGARRRYPRLDGPAGRAGGPATRCAWCARGSTGTSAAGRVSSRTARSTCPGRRWAASSRSDHRAQGLPDGRGLHQRRGSPRSRSAASRRRPARFHQGQGRLLQGRRGALAKRRHHPRRVRVPLDRDDPGDGQAAGAMAAPRHGGQPARSPAATRTGICPSPTSSWPRRTAGPATITPPAASSWPNTGSAIASPVGAAWYSKLWNFVQDVRDRLRLRAAARSGLAGRAVRARGHLFRYFARPYSIASGTPHLHAQRLSGLHAGPAAAGERAAGTAGVAVLQRAGRGSRGEPGGLRLGSDRHGVRGGRARTAAGVRPRPRLAVRTSRRRRCGAPWGTRSGSRAPAAAGIPRLTATALPGKFHGLVAARFHAQHPGHYRPPRFS